ncbi:unnamed protein product [Cuscuta europaea]|uniref:Uncharacterized protein n=1 Tax=Cuscuta europaea TaxID=41803 RepID=A0A9P1E1M9_CUSEU|nr:unnamed protein product [Cuscuta europaea]
MPLQEFRAGSATVDRGITGESGRDINIWKDPWLPDRNSPRVTSAPITGLEQASVDSLRREDGLDWDLDFLGDLFNQRDIRLIQGIPMSYRQIPDKVCWRWEDSGRFTVRSCYRNLAGDMVNGGWTGWAAMWAWMLPPKKNLADVLRFTPDDVKS